VTRTYFTDRNLGKAFPQALRDAGLAVERFDDHFGPSTADEDWLETIGKKRWVALSRDRKIRYKPNERDAVMRHGVALLLLGGNASHAELARNVIATRDRIEAFLARQEPPFIAKVSPPSPEQLKRFPEQAGSVDMWLSHAQWKRRRHRR